MSQTAPGAIRLAERSDHETVERHSPNRGVVYVTDYVTPAHGGDGPEGFLVDYPPNIDSRAHFHPVDQFQIMFGAPGTYYQRHPVPKVLLRYTDAYSVYGPFGSGSDPLSFFTLRARSTQVTGRLPEDRDLFVRRGSRNLHLNISDVCGEEVPDEGAMRDQPLIQNQPDGLSATLYWLGPSAEIDAHRAGESGQYVCVLEGALGTTERSIGPRSLGWVDPGAVVPTLRAGAAGAVVVAVVFPFPATTNAGTDTISTGAVASQF